MYDVNMCLGMYVPWSLCGRQRIRPTVSSLISLWVLGIELGLSALCGRVCFSAGDKMLWLEASEKREGFYWLTLPNHNPSCREFRVETEAEPMEEYCLPSLPLSSPTLSLLSYTTQTHVCMNDVPTVDWALPDQCQSRQSFTDMTTGQLMGAVLQ